jgi:hypothetical protein
MAVFVILREAIPLAFSGKIQFLPTLCAIQIIDNLVVQSILHDGGESKTAKDIIPDNR